MLLLLAHRVKVRQQLFTLHHETLLHSALNDKIELLVVHIGLQLFDFIVQNLYPLFEISSVDQVLGRLRSEVLTNHRILLQEVLIAQLDCVQFFLEALDVLLLGHLHLLEDLLLRVEFSVQIFGPRDRLINLVLELHVLLLQDLNLAIGRVEFDLAVLEEKHLVLEL